jgi:hypothetical protein
MVMRRRLVLMLAVATCAAGAAAVPAWAQPPANDTFEHATRVSSVPFSDTVDTTGATTDATDAEARAACGFSVPVAATVWYAFTPSTDSSLVISTSGTDYSTGVAVVTGTPGHLSAIDCFAGLGSVTVTGGQTYRIGVADIGGGSGGTLRLAIDSPGAVIDVDRFGTVDRTTGVATITGALICPSGSPNTIAGFMTQQRGQTTVFGSSLASPTRVSCTGTPVSWSLAIFPAGGFRAGPASVEASASVFVPLGGIGDFVSRTVILRPGH